MRHRSTGAACAFVCLSLLVACHARRDQSECTGGCVSLTRQALTSTIPPVADAYVRAGTYAASNFGTATQLAVKTQSSDPNNIRWSYLRFALGTVTGPVSSAKLRLYGSRPGANPAQDGAYGVSSNTWTETGITWNDKPELGAAQGVATVGTTAQYYEWDVTSFVAAEKAAGRTHANLAVKMNSDVTIAADTFNSREAASNRPQLVVTFGNQPPAVAITAPANGATFTAPANLTVDVTASDSDGTVARVELTRNGQLVGSDTTAPYSFPLSSLAAGAHALQATAFDNQGATGAHQLAIAVNVAMPDNLPPIAEAGASRFAVAGRLVTLNGSASWDPDVPPAPLSYAWSQLAGPTVTLSAPTTATPSFTPPAAGSYRFQLIVSDGQQSAADTVTVTVNGAESGPALLSEAVIFHDAPVQVGDFPNGFSDGVISTLALGNIGDVPVSVTFMFRKPIKVVGAAGVFGGPGTWTLEAAANLTDLRNRNGTYRKLVNNAAHVPADWSRAAFAEATYQVFRLIDDRPSNSNNGWVEIMEFELTMANRRDLVRMHSPRGLTVDNANQRIVADMVLQKLFVFDEAGNFVGEIGAEELVAPYDVAVDAQGDILVADRGANAIFKFDPAGAFLGEVAGPGSAPGEVQSPTGIAVDYQGRILVSELGNHRVQRLLPDGSPDPSFGSGGVIGTGASTRTNAGFDQPMDIAWDAARQDVVVADRGTANRQGNNRIQIFDESGTYLRTVSAVYEVKSVATDTLGMIFAGGGSIAVSGPLGAMRMVEPGGDFVTSYYRNGAAGLGSSSSGLAWDLNGKLVISDEERRAFLTYEHGQRGELYDVSTKAGPNWMEISYKTQLAGPTVVHWGQSRLDSTATNPTPTTDHTIRITGLQASTRYFMVPTYPRTMDGGTELGPDQLVATEPAVGSGNINVMRIRAAAVIYTSTMPAARAQQLREAFDAVEEFYFRNSHGRLWLDIDRFDSLHVLTPSDMDMHGPKPEVVQGHLAARGYSDSNPLDLVIAAHGLPGGNFGGSGTFFGRQAGWARFTTPSLFVTIHEVNHAVDDPIFLRGGQPRYPFNHGLYFIEPVIKGLDGSVNGELIRTLSAANIIGLQPPWGVLTAVADADGDGLSSDSRLPVTDPNPAVADADGDGLTDLQELERGIFRGTSSGAADTDGDAATQGNDRRDRNPLLPMNAYVARGTPQIDGTFGAQEEWTLVMNGVNFQNPFSIHTLASNVDTQQHLNTKIWSAWNDTGVYFAIEFTDRASSLDRLHFRTDLSDRGWYDGVDKHDLVFDGTGLIQNKLHAMTQDISAIVGEGQWSDVYDDVDAWTAPTEMALAPLFIKSELVSEIRLVTGTTDRYYVEFKIPAGARRSFLPLAGKPINFIAYHETAADTWDILTELDTGARLLLVNRDDTDGDGKWDEQEVDIGTNPLVAD